MKVIPKKLSFQLRFRNKTKTRKIFNRGFRLQKLLKRSSSNSNSFCYSPVQLVEKQKNVLKHSLIPLPLKMTLYPKVEGTRVVEKAKTYFSKGLIDNRINLSKPEMCHNVMSFTKSEAKYLVSTRAKRNTYWLPNKKKFLNNPLKPSDIYLKKKRAAQYFGKPRANKLLFGRYGICFKQYGIISSKCAEAAKLTIAKNLRKKGRFWLRICCDSPISARPQETRMGKGKGSISYWAAKVNPGQLFFEFSGIHLVQLKEVYQTLCSKSAVCLKIVY